MILFKKSWFTAVTTNEAPIHEKIASYFTFRGKKQSRSWITNVFVTAVFKSSVYGGLINRWHELTWVKVANWVSFGEFLVSQRQNYFSLVWKEKCCFYLNKHSKYVVEAIRNKHVRYRALKSTLGIIEYVARTKWYWRPIFCTWSYIILSFRKSKEKRGGKI